MRRPRADAGSAAQAVEPASLLEVRGLSVAFAQEERQVPVVTDVSFSIRPGESYGLVGESGSGKSTTAHCLLGYRRPGSTVTSGSVHLAGQDLLRLSPRALRGVRGRHVSLVPQNPTTALSPGLRVVDQLVEAMQVHGVGSSRSERSRRARELLEQVGLPDAARTGRRYPHQLSGGQQQRVTIAMALSCSPELVVLDEPTTGLDVTTQAQVLELLARLRAELGMALLYVTHNLGVISAICDRVGVLYAGRLVEEAPTRELFSNPRHPYTRGLIESVPSLLTPDQPRKATLRGLLRREELPAGCPFAPRCDFATERSRDRPQVLEPVALDHRVACERWRDIPALATAVDPDAEAGPAPPSPDADPLLELLDLDLGYGRPRRWSPAATAAQLVVRDVSLVVRPGETVALVGESGSGKSTIARAVGGLLDPRAGTIRFEGQGVAGTAERRSRTLRREIQLVLQNPDASLNPRQRVREVVGRPLELFFGLGRREREARVVELLEDVRLPGSFASRFPDELSGGERQRVAIARAVGARPKLILCDEVLSALDVSVQANVLDLLRGLQAEQGVAYLFISHDLAVVRSIAHRVGVLYRGELCEVGPAEDVYVPPYHPYTHALLAAVPEVGRTIPPRAEVTAEPLPVSVGAAQGCAYAHRCRFKLGAICDQERPPWQSVDGTHEIRCHRTPADLRVLETAPDHAVPTSV